MNKTPKTYLAFFVERFVPEPIVNTLLLKFPILYKTKFMNYETFMGREKGLDDLLSKLETVLDIEGDIIECGSARCGTTVIMANYLLKKGSNKKIYALDLFGGGFELGELRKERQLGLTSDKFWQSKFTYNSYDYVKRKIKKLGLSNVIIPVKGLFQNTLPSIDSKFCLSLIDCDLKDSMTFAAETLLPKMTKNSVMLFDDYLENDYKGARLAVDDFLQSHRSERWEHRLLNRLYYVRITR